MKLKTKTSPTSILAIMIACIAGRDYAPVPDITSLVATPAATLCGWEWKDGRCRTYPVTEKQWNLMKRRARAIHESGEAVCDNMSITWPNAEATSPLFGAGLHLLSNPSPSNPEYRVIAVRGADYSGSEGFSALVDRLKDGGAKQLAILGGGTLAALDQFPWHEEVNRVLGSLPIGRELVVGGITVDSEAEYSEYLEKLKCTLDESGCAEMPLHPDMQALLMRESKCYVKGVVHKNGKYTVSVSLIV